MTNETPAPPAMEAEAVDGPTEIEIDRLRLAAFRSGTNENKAAYYLAVSKWFQDRHYRRLASPPKTDNGVVEALRERIAILEAALEPFAKMNERLERDYPGYPDATMVEVPREPTEAMLNAVSGMSISGPYLGSNEARDIWDAMIAPVNQAAPDMLNEDKWTPEQHAAAISYLTGNPSR